MNGVPVPTLRRYEFTNRAEDIDIDAIVRQLATSEQIHTT